MSEVSEALTVEQIQFLDAMDLESDRLFQERAYAGCNDGSGENVMAERIAAGLPDVLHWTLRETLGRASKMMNAFYAQVDADWERHSEQDACLVSGCPNCNADYDPVSVESRLLQILDARRPV